MDFKNANELLTLCKEQNISISEVMRNREIITGECPAKEADQKMARVLEIMKEAARSPIEKPIRSMGGLIGGEAPSILPVVRDCAVNCLRKLSLMLWQPLRQMRPWD